MPDSAIFFLPLLPPFLRWQKLTQLLVHLLRGTGDFHMPKSSCQSMEKVTSLCEGRGHGSRGHSKMLGEELPGGEKLLPILPKTSHPQLPFQESKIWSIRCTKFLKTTYTLLAISSQDARLLAPTGNDTPPPLHLETSLGHHQWSSWVLWKELGGLVLIHTSLHLFVASEKSSLMWRK